MQNENQWTKTTAKGYEVPMQTQQTPTYRTHRDRKLGASQEPQTEEPWCTPQTTVKICLWKQTLSGHARGDMCSIQGRSKRLLELVVAVFVEMAVRRLPSSFRLLSLSVFPVWARIKNKKICDCGGAKNPPNTLGRTAGNPQRRHPTVHCQPYSGDRWAKLNHAQSQSQVNHVQSHDSNSGLSLKSVEDVVGHPHIQKTATQPYTVHSQPYLGEP